MIRKDGAARAIYRCKIHGDFVLLREDGQHTRQAACTAFTGMNEDRTEITQCGRMCEMTSLAGLLDKDEPTIRGLDDDAAQELIETVRELKKDFGENGIARKRFVTQDDVNKTKTRLTLEKAVSNAREEMLAELERPFDL